MHSINDAIKVKRRDGSYDLYYLYLYTYSFSNIGS